MYKKLCVFFVLFLITSLLYSDTITLKNGQKYEGKIINQTKERVQIRLENGKELVINKNDIQKIQFGPTPEEIRKKQEEEKRRLEEAKKQEEERKKLEEEKRRLEEAKKQEEERRKLEEEKRKALLKKEPLLKRKELLVYWGVGPTNAYLPLESLYNIFTKKVDQLYLISPSRGKFFSTIQGIGTNTSNSLLEVVYNENDWSFGLETIIFELSPLLKNISFNTFIQGTNFSRFPPETFLNYEFSNGLKIGKNNSYDFTNFYIKYHFHKWKFFNGTGLLSFPIGIMSHNFDLETEYSVMKMDLLNPSPSIELTNPSAKQNIQSDNTNMLYSGIHLENSLNDAFKWKILLNIYYGNFQHTINVNQLDIINSQYSNVIVIPSGIQRGIGLTNRLEKNIRDSFFVFLDLTYREIQSNVSTIKIDGIVVAFGNNTSLLPLNFFSPFGISWLDGKSKRIKEINRNLSFGIIYRFGL